MEYKIPEMEMETNSEPENNNLIDDNLGPKRDPKVEDFIDNNIEKNKGIVQLITEEENNTIKIKKELLKSINFFIACLGAPGSGKSTFGSNYYKKLYNVKNDYFESSDEELSFTKGIWMINDEERRKIPKYIYKDLLDVEGFQVDDIKSWKYVMILAFLSSDLIILNTSPRYDDVRKMIKIIENSLRRMLKKNIPIILKNIYIQTTKIPKKTIETLLKSFNYDEKVFQKIKFQYIYLPFVYGISEKDQDLMKYPDYKNNFENILNLLNRTSHYNSVSSLINYIDMFNEAINGNEIFNSQTILKDIEFDFNGVYIRYEKKLKNELSKNISKLTKLDNLNETFEDFINKQKNLNFEFKIDNEEFTFYGPSEYNDYYESLKKTKTFKVDPRDVFLDFYNTEKIKLESLKKSKIEQEIEKEYLQKIQIIDNYFALLKFKQKIDNNIDLKLKIDISGTGFELKRERENNLINYYNEKKKEKIKEWEEQIERAKWKAPVQVHGNMTCKNGHKIKKDVVYCGKCHGDLFWVDSDEKYVLCKNCNNVRKISEKLVDKYCGAEVNCEIKWIHGYKP